jgi:hypothetical protein
LVTCPPRGRHEEETGIRPTARLFADITPLRSPDFRRLWVAGIPTVIGANLTVFAVPVQSYALTQNSAYVGLAGIFALVPLVVFGLVGSDDVVGRLQGVFTVVVAGGPRLADFVHGAAAAVAGTTAAAAGAGGLVVLRVIIASLAAPEFIRYRARRPSRPRDKGGSPDGKPCGQQT